MKSTIKRILKSVGFYLERYNSCTVEAEQIRFLIHANSINCVFDVGANVGLAVLLFLEKFPVTRLVCVEPESANFRLLQRNLRSTPAVALHATNGVVKIDSSSQAYNTKIIAHTGTTKVVAMSMPSLLHSQGLA